MLKKRLLSLTALCGILFLSTSATHATVADGVYAYQKGNYQQARKEWLPYAALGNPNALYNLGQLYRMGRGVEADYTKAEKYYLRAAEKGHVGAQRNLGTLYYFGRMGKKDHAKALNWLLKAAINGDARSQFVTGTMYFNGEAVEKNNIQAYAWILLASQNGLSNATATIEKLKGIMTPDQIRQANELAPDLISRQLSPDDVGLMISPPEAKSKSAAEPNNKALILQAAQAETMTLATTKTKTAAPSPDIVADNFRVQLGSFRTEPLAEKTLASLMVEFSTTIDNKQGKIEFADLGAKGTFYRIQLRPFKIRSEAAHICSRFKELGQECLVVKSPD